MNIQDINSAGIKAAAVRAGLTEITPLGAVGEGDSKITIYQFGPVRVADTNGDPVWEEADAAAFAELAEQCGI